MLAKLNKTHGTNRNYIKPRSEIQSSFGFNHFAGIVFYDARGRYFEWNSFFSLLPG